MFSGKKMDSSRKSSTATSISASLDLTCDPCRFSGKTSFAIKYCRDCNGHFCSFCAKSHASLDSTKSHRLTSMEKRPGYRRLVKIHEKCNDHGAILSSFCENHNELCCHVCVMANHSECSKIAQLQDPATTEKASKMCKNLETLIKNLQSQFDNIRINKLDYIKSLEQQNDAFMASVRMFRKTVNGMLNKLEDDVMKQKDDIKKEKSEHVKDHIKTCNTAINVLDEAYKQLEMTLRLSEADIFIGTKKVEVVVNKYTDVLNTIQVTPDKQNFHFDPDGKIEEFLTGLKALGEVRLGEAPGKMGNSTVSPRKGIPTSEHPLKKPSYASEAYVRMKTDKRACHITGATFLQDGRIVLTDDANNSLKLFASDFKPLASLELNAPPRDITAMGQFEVAITVPSSKQIQMYKVNNKSLEMRKSLIVDTECYGITYSEPDLYVTSGWSSEREIQVIAPLGELRKKIKLSKKAFRYPLYISIDNENATLYVSDYINGIVAMDMSGNILFNCKDLRRSSYYKGVLVALPGQVYSCTWQQNTVGRIHGKSLETMITWPPDDKRKPLALAYAYKTKRLIVSFSGDKRDMMSIYRFYWK